MASIYCPRFRALNANGAPVSGGGLWVFEAGTTTPADIFTNDGLSTPAANPLTSDSNGYFPQFFIASGATVDLQVRQTTSLTSTLLWSADDVDSLGAEDASAFYRDFGANGRLQARGAGGLVRLEFGNPDGDDVGGAAVISGWNGTTGDDLTFDFSEATFGGNLTVEGNLAVDGTMQAPKLLASGEATGVATVDIPLPGAYETYQILVDEIAVSTALALYGYLAFDSVPTFKSGAGDYTTAYYSLISTTNATGSAAGGKNTSHTLIFLGTNISPTSSQNGAAEINVHTSAARETLLEGRVTATNGSYEMAIFPFVAMTRDKSYGKATYLRIATSTGTVSLRYKVLGIPY